MSPDRSCGRRSQRNECVSRETTGLHQARVCAGLTRGLGSTWKMQAYLKWSVFCYLHINFLSLGSIVVQQFQRLSKQFRNYLGNDYRKGKNKYIYIHIYTYYIYLKNAFSMGGNIILKGVKICSQGRG